MTTQTNTRKRRAIPPAMMGFVGMILVPLGVMLATNSWTAPDAAAYVRMAFGIAIASTMAVTAAWWLAVTRMKAGGRDRYLFWGVAGIFTLFAIGSINGAAEKLTNLINL